jgi:hypothetical protein
MCTPIAAAIALSSVAGAGIAGSQSRRALNAQTAAQREAAAAAAKTQADAQQAEAKANRQAPNLASLFKANKVGSAAATLLTGPGGAPLQNMALGRNTLLGG